MRENERELRAHATSHELLLYGIDFPTICDLSPECRLLPHFITHIHFAHSNTMVNTIGG